MSHTAVIVVSYGSAALVDDNLSPLAEAAPEFDVIVVDCRTTADEGDRVGALCAARGWTPVLLDRNAGFGGGVDAGAAVALQRGAQVLLVLNPDATLTAEAARALAAAAAPGDALVAPRIERPDGSLWTAGVDLYLDDGTHAGIRHRDSRAGRPRMFWVSGACIALSAALWRRIGGFDDAYFLYWEDVDLSARAHAAGVDVRVLDDVVAVHDEGGTHEDRGRGRAKSETYYYFNIRNRLLYARRHLDAAGQRRWRRTALRASWAIVMQGGRRQLASAAPWRALVRGLRDGRRGVTGPLRG